MSMCEDREFDIVILMSAILVSIAIVICFGFFCFKFSNMKLKQAFKEASHETGIPVDIEKQDHWDPKDKQFNPQEPCIIIAPNMDVTVAW